MTAWEEVKAKGIEAARVARRSLGDEGGIRAAFADWWRVTGDADVDQRTLTQEHLGTKRLADQLRAAGADAAADFASSPWRGEGPIHPGTWLFSMLIGESFVPVFVEALREGRLRRPEFCGLDSFGAWEAFDATLRLKLKEDQGATAAAISWLAKLVESIKADPVRYAGYQARVAGTIQHLVERYAQAPRIDDAWENPYDPQILLENSFLWDVLLELRSAETLVLLGAMPHPAFIRACLWGKRLERHPDELARLIRIAPQAFAEGDRFQADGAVAAHLLEIAGAAIQLTTMDEDGTVRIVSADRPDLLSGAIERCEAATKVMVDELFARPDAVPLAWAWLDRLISQGKLRRRWPVRSASSAGFMVNVPMLLILAVAKRLPSLSDWEAWVESQENPWRISRAMAIVAVESCGQGQDPERLASRLTRVLVTSELDYAGLAEAMASHQDLVAMLGGCALCALADPAGWFASTWEKLRPIRERNWRITVDGGKRNNSAELLVLWGFGALDRQPHAARASLWKALELAIRDAWQTDAMAYAPVLHVALVRLFSYIAPNANDQSPPFNMRLSQLLLPYIDASHGFLVLLIALIDRGWSVDRIGEAVTEAGFDLPRLVDQFLAMKEMVFSLPQANQPQIKKFRELAKALER